MESETVKNLEALKHGGKRNNRVPVYFIGPDRAGKTSLKKRLLGEDYINDQSNDFVQAQVEVEEKNQLAAWGNDTRNLSGPLYPRKVNANQAFKLSGKRKNWKERRHENECPIGINGGRSQNENGGRDGSPNNSGKVICERLPDNLQRKIMDAIEEVNNYADDMKTIRFLFYDLPISSLIYNVNWVMAWLNSLFIHVIDLETALAADLDFMKDTSKRIPIPRHQVETNLHYVNKWMAALFHLNQCFSGDMDRFTRAPVILVFTKPDKLDDASDEIKQKFEKVQKKFRDSFMEKNWHAYIAGTYLINVRSDTSSADDMATLRAKIFQTAQEILKAQEKIPTNWIKLERAFTAVQESRNCAYITLEEAKELGRLCEVNETFSEAMKCLHEKHVVVHYQSHQPESNLVVINPHWLMELFTKVTALPPRRGCSRDLRLHQGNCPASGVLDKEALQNALNAHCSDQSEALMRMMLRGNLIIHWYQLTYLIPSTVACAECDNALDKLSEGMQLLLCVNIDGDCVPLGFFLLIQQQLINWSRYDGEGLNAPELCCNFGRFFKKTNGIAYSVVSTCHRSRVEVAVHGDTTVNVANEVGSFVTNAVKAIHSSHSVYKHMKYKIILKSELFYEGKRKKHQNQKNVCPGSDSVNILYLKGMENGQDERLQRGNKLPSQKSSIHQVPCSDSRPTRNVAACECICILNISKFPSQFTKRVHEALITKDPSISIHPLEQPLMDGDTSVMFTKSPMFGILALSAVKPIIKITFQNFLGVSTKGSKRSARSIPCQCKTIFTVIEDILLEETYKFNTSITCQRGSLTYDGNELEPRDAVLARQLKPLVMKLHDHKNSMADLVTRNFITLETGRCGETTSCNINETGEALTKELCEVRFMYHETCKQIHQLQEKLPARRDTRMCVDKRISNGKWNIESQTVVPDTFQSNSEISEGQENGGNEITRQNSAIHTASGYPLSKLLHVFSERLLLDEWDGLRRVMSGYIPASVLSNLPNGMRIFDELVNRNLITCRSVDLLRGIFYEIQRVDFVHLIDYVVEGDYHLLDNEDEEQMSINVVTSSRGAVAVQETGGLNVEENQVEDASRTQVIQDVNNGDKTRTGGNFVNRMVVRETQKDISEPEREDISYLSCKDKNSTQLSQTSVSSPWQEISLVRNNAAYHDTAGMNTQAQEIASEGRFNESNDADYRVTSRAGQVVDQSSRYCLRNQDGGNPSESACEENRPLERKRGERNAGSNERLEVSCKHYDRYCDVQFSCCERFWPCHRCHNSESKCGKKKLRSRDIKKIKCKRCKTVQEFPRERPFCVECGLKFAEYYCSLCQHLTGKQNYPYHCEGCGICRVHEDRSFHCDECGVCLDIHLLENHLCRAGSAHDECCICFEDAFSGCQILPCSHKVHKDCATMMLQNGITKCPICRQSFAHLIERRVVQR